MAQASDVFSGRTRYSLVVTSNQLSQSIPNNTSTVSIVVQVVETTENGTWSNAAASWNSWVNGSTNSGTFTYDFRAVNSITLFNSSKTVAHNADGKKSIWFEASVGGGTVIGSAYAGATLVLSTIPRASTSTWAPGTPTTLAGGTYTLNTNRASSSFTHTITYKFGSATGTIGTGVGASVSWTIPMELLDEIPNSTTGSGVITTKTYNGSTLIGTTTSNFAVTAPTSVVPTWTSVSTSEGNSDVATKVGALVQGVSKVSYSIVGASGVYSSTISSQKLVVAGQTVNGATGTTPNPISSSGTVPAVFTITDSRGRTKTQTNNLTVLPYTTPTVTSHSEVRSLSDGTPAPDSGTYIKVTLNANVQSLVNGTQKNSIQIKVRARLRGSTTPWTDASTLKQTLNPGGIAYNSSFVVTGPFTVDESYEIRVEVIDIFNTTAVQTTIPVAAVFMHWDGSLGVGIGKYRENGTLDVSGDINSTTAVRAPLLYQNGRATLSYQQRVIFTSSGTFSKASYPWLRAIRVMVVGGGGSGAGCGGASGGQNSYGTGGGSGAYAESFITNIAGLASSTTVTVGAGGAATAAGAIDGNNGGNSSFGSLVVAGGGGGGYAKPNTTLGGYVQGGLPGVATAGDIQQGGSPGGQGAGLNTLSQSGNGGSSIFGGGGFGPATGAGSGANAGNPGTAWGAGGSGAAANAGGVARPSGAGASGVVIVELYA